MNEKKYVTGVFLEVFLTVTLRSVSFVNKEKSILLETLGLKILNIFLKATVSDFLFSKNTYSRG